MTAVTLLAFAGLCLLLSITPGPDTFLVLRISLQSAAAGLAAALGSALASLVWAALVGVGLAAILEDSAEVFRWLKIAGGLYLLYLGISSLIRARRTKTPAGRSPLRAGATAEGPGSAPARSPHCSTPRSACSISPSCRSSFPTAATRWTPPWCSVPSKASSV